MRCSACDRAPAPFTTVSGRRLCDSCHRRLVGLAGAGSAMVDGASTSQAVQTGIAAGGFHDAVRGEQDAARRRRAKLDATTGFWRRMWVRVVG